MVTYMQAGSFLMPFALSLQLLPSADRYFTCQWNKNIYWQVLYLSVIKKIFILTGKVPVSIYFFSIFLKNWYFSITLTGKVPVSNKKLQPSTCEFDRCFTCQRKKKYVFSYTLTGKVPVSNKKTPTSHFDFDRYFTCQCLIFYGFS